MNYDTFDLFEEALQMLHKLHNQSRQARLSHLIYFLEESAKVKGYDEYLPELEAIFEPQRAKIAKAREIEAEYGPKNEALLKEIKEAGYHGDPFGFMENLRKATTKDD
jgi:hypothetical protein